MRRDAMNPAVGTSHEAGAGPAPRISLTRCLVGGLVLAAALAGQAQAAGPSGGSTYTGEKPAEIEIGDDGLKTMILTGRAVERIGVETVEISPGPGGYSIVPVSAGVYLPDGSTWVYVEIAEHTYKRAPIDIHDVSDAGIVLISGPDTGVTVVTAGVSEFWGLEDGVGE